MTRAKSRKVVPMMWQSLVRVEMAQDVADDVCESWEDMIENGILEKKLEELQMRVPKINSASKEEENELCSPMPQFQLEDTSRTQYVPQVKILKRPNDAKSGPVGIGVEKSPIRQPMKSLQQREAEYAEARLRILGSASSEEENQKMCLTPLNVSEKTETVVNVIRLPHGPDGSQGFLQRR